MPLQLIFLRNVSLLSVRFSMWETVHSARAVCVISPEIVERSLSRGACGRNTLDCRSLNLTSSIFLGMGRSVGEERLANDWVGLRVWSEWNWSKKKKKSLRYL